MLKCGHGHVICMGDGGILNAREQIEYSITTEMSILFGYIDFGELYLVLHFNSMPKYREINL